MKKIRFAVGSLIFIGKKILLVKKVKMMDGKNGVEDIEPFWDFPKGGIKEGENYEKALYRELKEEIGTDKFKLISSLEDFNFDFNESIADKIGYKSQITKMFLVEFLGKEDDLKIIDEEIGDLKFFEINKAIKKATMLNSKKYIKANFK